MIVCHCNVLSDRQILDAVGASGGAPASPMEAYRCLGCSPKCGRCFATVRALLNDASAAACAVGCVSCPAHEHHHAEAANDADAPVYLIAAE